jgi:hypothetical protein
MSLGFTSNTHVGLTASLASKGQEGHVINYEIKGKSVIAKM